MPRDTFTHFSISPCRGCCLGYLAGVAIQALAPVTIHAQVPRFAVWLVGLVLVVAGSALAGWCLVIFRRARTTTVPLEKSSTVVTWGPYRWSRNPMYVALTLIYLGETAIFAHLWPAVLLLPDAGLLNTASSFPSRKRSCAPRSGRATATMPGACDAGCDA